MNRISFQYTISSDAESSSKLVEELLQCLPDPNYVRIKGKPLVNNSGVETNIINKKTRINFQSVYINSELEFPMQSFIEYWKSFEKCLDNCIKLGFFFSLNIEISKVNDNFPVLILQPENLNFLSKYDFKLSFTLYEEE